MSHIFTNVCFSAVAFFAFSHIAFAQEPAVKLGSYSQVSGDAESLGDSLFQPSKYQLGDEWGKRVVTPKMLSENSAAFQRAAYAAAKVGGGTGFYLGTFAGHHVVATNHHVLPNASACRTAEFPLFGKKFLCDKFFGTWTDIDLALFSIRIDDASSVAALDGVGKNFSFDAEMFAGRPLLTIGFGIAENPRRKMVANQDSDCVVFSQANEFRFMADPDDVNPGPYKAWSFANGCDVSHGDSGSAMVDRSTGDVLGIIWTGRIPKNPEVQNSKYLSELLKTPTEAIWKELSYGVPAAKMKEHFVKLLADSATNEETRKVLRALIGE